MATEKKTTTEPEFIDRMKEKVTVILPRATGKEDDTLFVALNGKGYNIKRGIPVRVPRPIADIIRESDRQVEKQNRYKDKIRAEAGKSARAAFQSV